MDITALPSDLFILIAAYLSPRDSIISRRVSRGWQAAFTNPRLCRLILQQHYPNAREVRQVRSEDTCWIDILSTVASRYHYLQSGKPRAVEKLPLCKSVVKPDWARNHPVATWQRHLQFEEKTAPFHYPDTLWTYDDGLLLYPSSEEGRYVIYDLAEESQSAISFDFRDRIVRRMRLCDGVLVLEWCEGEPYHQLNESEKVFRHFATAFDMVRDPERRGRWITERRSEWRIHFLGLPLNTKDRFYSTHDRHHYAMYLWQPNRSAWGEDDPIEALAIWDISRPSTYQPSNDPACRQKPDESLEGPRVVKRLSFTDLDHYHIRQRSMPTLRNLALDDHHVYFIEENHRWLVGQQAGHNLPRLHKVKSIGVPLAAGPSWEDECGADGDVNLSFCERASEERRGGLAPCWRHEEFPYLTISEAVDAEAGVRFCARHCFMLETLSISIKPSVYMSGPGYEVSLKDDLWQQLLVKGKICGDERFLIGENDKQEVVVLHFDARRAERSKAW